MNMQVPALTVAESSLPVTLRDALDSAADLARAEKATATKRAYVSDFPSRPSSGAPRTRPRRKN
jgi:hypothetical protein